MEAYNRRDMDVCMAVFDADVQAYAAVADGAVVGGGAGSWRGSGGFRLYWESWDEAWADFRNDAEVDVLDFGDNILVLYHFVGHGRGSGIEVRQPVAMLSALDHGRLVRWQHWWSWDEPLAAVGLTAEEIEAEKARIVAR